MLIADADGVIQFANGVARSVLGERLRPRDSFWAHRPVWAAALLQQDGIRAARVDRIWHGRTALLTLAGEELPLSERIIAYPDDGPIEFFACIARDLSAVDAAGSEIRRLNRDLQARLHELEAIFDVAPVGIIVARDPRGGEIVLNRAAERLLGDAAELNRKPAGSSSRFRFYRNGREVRPHELPTQVATREERVHGVELEAVSPDGQTLTLVEYATPLTGRDGQPAGGVAVLVDVSDRKRVEQDLRATQIEAERNFAKLNAVLGQMTEGVALADARGNVVAMNRAGLAMHGVDQVADVQKSLYELAAEFELTTIDGTALPADQWPLARALRGERFEGVELQVRHRSKAPWIASFGGAPIYDRNGRLILVVVTTRDVTTQKQSEFELEALTEALERRVAERTQYLALLRDVSQAANHANSSDAAFQHALKRICQYQRWRCAHVYHVSPGAPATLVLSGTWHAAMPEVFMAFRDAALAQPLARGAGLPGRVWETGQSAWTALNAEEWAARRLEPAPLDDGVAIAFPVVVGADVVAVVECFADEDKAPTGNLLDVCRGIGTQLGRVIERERSAAALLASQRLIQRINDSAPTLIFIFDLAAKREIYGNQRVTEFFGEAVDARRTGTDALILRHVHPDDRDVLDAALDRFKAMHDDEPLEFDACFRNAAGEWRSLRTRCVVFERDRDGAPRRILCLLIDVTEALANEDRLRRTERLAAIGTLASGIAHEVHNPLAAILMTAQFAEQDTHLPEELRGEMRDIIEDAQRCTRIVNTVQQMARVGSTPREPADLNAVVSGAVEIAAARAERMGVRIETDLAEALPPVCLNAGEIEQVLVNLVHNASEASKHNDVVRVITAHANDRVVISVCDDGCGIPDDVKDRIYDPFFTTKSQRGGTGLGLSICYEIVRSHDGTIEIESAPGHGTKFRIELPVAADAQQPVGSTAESRTK